MRVLTYATRNATGVGIRSEHGVIATPYPTMLDLIRDDRNRQRTLGQALREGEVLSQFDIKAPLTMPGKLLFSGINYNSHFEENLSAVRPAEPSFFSKLPNAVIGPGEPIMLPTPASEIDYEVELAVVIGKKASRLTIDAALAHVFGYTIVNDVSARDMQFKRNQLTLGKGMDTFCPMGPEIVLTDEISDPSRLLVTARVNGDVRQNAKTSDMIFTVEQLLVFLSQHVTLEPGDIVSTGTPAGVGAFRNPPLYLKPGDVVSVEVDAIGTLVNPVSAAW